MPAIKTDDIPRIANYSDAKRLYESVEPIHGAEHIRPLGKPTKHHMRIDKCVVDGVEVYEAVLYQTPCVRWYPDGRVLVDDGGWATQSTAVFIKQVLGGMSATSAYNYVSVCVDAGMWYAIPKGGLMLEKVGDQYRYQPVNPPKMYISSYNREETKRIRTIAKPVLEYFKTMRAVMGKDAPMNWREEQQKFHEVRLADVLRRLPEEPSTETLAALFVWREGKLSDDAVYKAALEAQITTYDELYDKKYLPPGEIKKGMRMEHTT